MIKERQSKFKRKEDELVKRDKIVKEKEAEISIKLKEIEEKEKLLKELEERLNLRKLKLNSEPKFDHNRLAEESPKIAGKDYYGRHL